MVLQWRKFNDVALQMKSDSMLTEIELGKVMLFVNANYSYSLMPRCFPHIINIATQTVNKKIKENPCMVVVSAATPADSPE